MMNSPDQQVPNVNGDQWRNNSRKNKETKPKQKQHPVVDVTSDGSKLQCCTAQCWTVSVGSLYLTATICPPHSDLCLVLDSTAP